jgi:hypothetical protein
MKIDLHVDPLAWCTAQESLAYFPNFSAVESPISSGRAALPNHDSFPARRLHTYCPRCGQTKGLQLRVLDI